MKKDVKDLKTSFTNLKQDENIPVIYQAFTVEKLFIDKYDMNQNITQLGVKYLSGTFHIGAAFEKAIVPQDLEKEYQEKFSQIKRERDEEQNQERINWQYLKRRLFT